MSVMLSSVAEMIMNHDNDDDDDEWGIQIDETSVQQSWWDAFKDDIKSTVLSQDDTWDKNNWKKKQKQGTRVDQGSGHAFYI